MPSTSTILFIVIQYQGLLMMPFMQGKLCQVECLLQVGERPVLRQRYKNFVVRLYMWVIINVVYRLLLLNGHFWISIASTGGLLGLGFGFSLLSAAEVFYYLFIRWMYYRIQMREEHQNAVVPLNPHFLMHTRAFLVENWVFKPVSNHVVSQYPMA